jgi:16S rRNA (guanine1207-N2)-methyltransferase
MPFLDLLAGVRARLKPPVLVALGAPRTAADIAASLELPDSACYQMDLYQADRLREELSVLRPEVTVETAADLWDLPGRYGTVLYPAPPRGERELKRDVAEQAYHVLKPHGLFVVLSQVPKDQFFPDLLKKIYGKVALTTGRDGTTFWCPHDGDRPRRRHEQTVQVNVGGDGPLRFVSRPGVFTYGRLDDGARALLDVVEVKPGDRIMEIGCGTGATGIAAVKRAGPGAAVTFVDSNARAVALAELNARSNGLTDFQALTATRLEGLPAGRYDLALANPPYYAQQAIAQMFVERAHTLLKPGGRFYLVTKLPGPIEPLVRARFGPPVVLERRGYAILTARRRR